jgi:hypothetical protein
MISTNPPLSCSKKVAISSLILIKFIETGAIYYPKSKLAIIAPERQSQSLSPLAEAEHNNVSQ